MFNSPKRSIRQKKKRLAKLDLKNDADTDPSPASADFNITKRISKDKKNHLSSSAQLKKLLIKKKPNKIVNQKLNLKK